MLPGSACDRTKTLPDSESLGNTFTSQWCLSTRDDASCCQPYWKQAGSCWSRVSHERGHRGLWLPWTLPPKLESQTETLNGNLRRLCIMGKQSAIRPKCWNSHRPLILETQTMARGRVSFTTSSHWRGSAFRISTNTGMRLIKVWCSTNTDSKCAATKSSWPSGVPRTILPCSCVGTPGPFCTVARDSQCARSSLVHHTLRV